MSSSDDVNRLLTTGLLTFLITLTSCSEEATTHENDMISCVSDQTLESVEGRFSDYFELIERILLSEEVLVGVVDHLDVDNQGGLLVHDVVGRQRAQKRGR